ncbi:gamma carbonic anhydrase 3 [Striga asiatica]|uniref:Gamma carbonic anhydrase 3 n=1 Tax=Striga asiatica TaxID=4170 RepID=A0A5A7P8G7_STRAF|nr:gamma carbonic anhydrase 3 [Striga asiatica]
MASFCSHSILRPPTSVPAKSLISSDASLCAAYLILRAHTPFITAGTSAIILSQPHPTKMASFCSHSILRPPTSVPAKSLISSDASLCGAYLILRAHTPFITAGTLSRPPRAVSPQTYVYPDPIPEFADAVNNSFYLKCDVGGADDLGSDVANDCIIGEEGPGLILWLGFS